MLLLILQVAGWSNAVNLTDGLDGLATGATVLVLAAYALIANWQVRNTCSAYKSPCTATRSATRWTWPSWRRRGSARASGSCGGTPPGPDLHGRHRVAGAGRLLAGLAVCTQTLLLLVILGGLFVIITLSVIIQVGFFKMTGGGYSGWRRCSIISSWSGWAETTIVVRFWIIAGLFIALGLGVFYLEWLPG